MSSKHIARLAQNSFWRSRTFAQTLGACRWRDHAIVLLESRRRTTGPQGQNRLFSSVSQYPDASPTSKPERAREGPVSTSTSDVALNSALQKKASGRDLVLSPPALVITREYEWANLLVGFEQANRYSIRSAPGGEVVGYLAEENSIGSTITRNFLRTHRPFKATVFDKDQNIIFQMRRPMYLFSTSIFIESAEGEVLGEVHMNWHMWRRRYNLYVDKAQFASVDSGFLAVDFDMRDIEGRKIASVNKDFTGFARELFTDARQYVIRMDPSYGLEHDATLVSDAATLGTSTEDLGAKVGHRERAVILASAIAVDFDYFSLHSRGHMHPGLMMMPGGGGAGAPVPSGGAGAGGAGAMAGADILSDTMNEGEAVNTESSGGAEPLPGDEPFDDTNAGADGFSNPSTDFDTAAGQGESEWATFEEPDHGFDDSFSDESAWSAQDDSWDGDTGGDEGGASGGLFGLIKDIFFDQD